MNIKLYNKKYRIEHQKEIKEYRKKYYKLHKKELQKYFRKYWKKHQKSKKEHDRKYRKINRIRINEYSKNYRQKNKLKIEQYRKNHKNKHRIYMKNKLKKDINFRLSCNLRRRIWGALKGINKSNSTIKLIGCSIEYLKKHLESKFTKGMNWKNYGKWHIDHIRPCVSFDLSKYSEQRKCFHYTNLQPLWAEDNYSKRKKDNTLDK